MLSLIRKGFAAAPRHLGENQVWRLSSRVANELALVAALTPMMATNLRAEWAPKLLASDASSSKMAYVSAPLTEGEGTVGESDGRVQAMLVKDGQ